MEFDDPSQHPSIVSVLRQVSGIPDAINRAIANRENLLEIPPRYRLAIMDFIELGKSRQRSA
jgi:hypothetical protein